MRVQESDEDIITKAREEEKAYNLLDAIKLYDQAAKSYINKKNLIKAKEIYIEIIKKSFFFSSASKTADEYIEITKLYIKVFTEGAVFFENQGMELEKLELETLQYFFESISAKSVDEAKEIINRALKVNSTLIDLYSKSKDNETPARILILSSFVLCLDLILYKDPIKFKEAISKIIEISGKAWKISIEIGDTFYMVLSLFIEYSVIFEEWYSTSIDDIPLIETYRKILDKCNESINILDSFNDPQLLAFIYYISGTMYCLCGYQCADDEFEQRHYFEKGVEHLEKSINLAKEVRNKYIIVMATFLLDQFAYLSGNFMYLQKRIMSDIQETSVAGEIYTNSTIGIFEIAHFYMNHLPAFYYSNIAQLSFFTPKQRLSYAKKAIEFAIKNLNLITFEPDKAMPYLALTFSYATLVQFAESKESRDANIEFMLNYANEAKRIGDKYPGGQVRNFGHSAFSKAYKTLADITDDKDKKIKMLLSVADVSKNNLKYATESRTGIITAQMRLGLLYEEIGILTKNEDTLNKGKDVLLGAIKGSLEKSYFSYAGTTYEYIARIEDRLGNHTASAENYINAQYNHSESLKNIEYKPLKKRVEEKIQYAQAWTLIEKAKAYHKNENHLNAKENYEKASKILKVIPRYNFEGFYNIAWAQLEQAELFSKQEKQQEAINQYKSAIQAFEEAIDVLKKVSIKSTEQVERERIGKFEQVAQIRIDYCSARINLEEAILLGKKGEHSTAAEKFAIAASSFRGVCTRYKLERERKELEAIYYLCRAWESMELAEKFAEPERFEYAANLFAKASNLFFDSKLKLLSSGNSAFCRALELGCKFDESLDINLKEDLYSKIKLTLSRAASFYGKSGFENVANWALASSIYFDAAWQLIQADKELDLNKRGRLLNIGSNYLKSSLELFSKAGYKNKVTEVQDKLNRVETEESILFSALSTLKEPSISRSTTGIVAPSCPIESSQSPRLGEARQFTEEELRVTMARMERKNYEIIYKDLTKEYPKVQKRAVRIGIAQIGISTTGNIMDEFYETSSVGLLKLKENKLTNVISKVKSMIERAHNEGVNVLLFPEMIIDLNYGEFLEEIADLAKLYGMLIIPGSFHDQETHRNISIVFGPDGILWEQEKH
ncbi:MAG: hypothetical protein EAX89_14990, partial [Candidatus Lokiarchaeota archaeon]|nr:hypothetical protein [Candidatus Lokiarchaeota archaeon]